MSKRGIRRGRGSRDLPVSQICALMVLSSIDSVLVANSTPMVDLESKLNSFRVNLDRTTRMKCLKHSLHDHKVYLHVRFLLSELRPCQYAQMVYRFLGVARTISRHQNHQSKRPVIVGFGVTFPHLRHVASRRTLKRKSKLLPSVMEKRFKAWKGDNLESERLRNALASLRGRLSISDSAFLCSSG